MPPHQRSSLEAGDFRRRAPALIGRMPREARGDLPPTSEAAALKSAVAPALRLPLPVIVFLVALVVPWVPNLGPLRLSPYRIVLIVMFIPCIARLAGRKAGPIRLPDIAIVLYSLWAIVCFGAIHGTGTALQSGGILAIETICPYLLARCYIRTADDFHAMVSLLFRIIVFLLPFGIVEMMTGQKPLLQLFGTILPTIDVTMMDRRWGLFRVQGPFEHPILFGVCCGSTLALTHMVLGSGQPFFRRWFKTSIVIGMAFLALSSGPLTALAAQIMLLAWNWVLAGMKSRWNLLWLVIVLINIAIYLYSGESAARFYVSHAPLFDSWSAYYRLLIWQYGSATVLNHPLFGIGFHEYERPAWMVPSVDMFWLNHGIMFGLPGAFLMGLAFLSTVAIVGRRRILDGRLNDFKIGYMISIAGFFCAGWTVHFWNGTYSLFLFLLASGLWLAQANPAAPGLSLADGLQRRVRGTAVSTPRGGIVGRHAR